MKYKAFLFDIDGTLVTKSASTISSQRLIQKFSEANNVMNFGFITLRPLPQVITIADQLNLQGYSIISGGAQIVSFPTREIVYEKSLSHQTTRTIIATLQKLSVNFYIQDNGIDCSPNKYKPRKPFIIIVTNITKDVATTISNALSQIRHLTITYGDEKDGQFNLLISHSHTTKAHALDKMAKLLQIKPRDIIGIGNDIADISFLEKCGLKMAVGNAIPEVKRIVDHIVSSVDEDGVADVIEKFILN